MKRLYFIVFSAAAIIVLLAGEIIIVKSISNFEPKVSVVYAKKFIPAKEEIKPDMLELREVNLSYSHRLSVSKLENVIGRNAQVPIESGEMVLSSKLGDGDEIPDIKLSDENNRLFTVEFKPDQANGWWLMVDQRVDIIYVPNTVQSAAIIDTSMLQELLDQNSRAYDTSKIKRLDNIRVAAIIDEKGNLLSNKKRDAVPRFVSFEVTNEQDELLAYAKNNGRLEISVRPSK